MSAHPSEYHKSYNSHNECDMSLKTLSRVSYSLERGVRTVLSLSIILTAFRSEVGGYFPAIYTDIFSTCLWVCLLAARTWDSLEDEPPRWKDTVVSIKK